MKQKFVYKNRRCMQRMHSFYDRALAALDIPYREEYINTSFGETHIVIAGDESKPRIFTLHGGNGISPLNLYLLRPLLENYCLIAPDVIGMPGKSAPYRNLNSARDDFGPWICELLDSMGIKSIPFVVSSYSSAMMLSLAKTAPGRIEKAALIVPSGFTHGPLWPIIRKMTVPFIRYYHTPSERALEGIMAAMGQGGRVWTKFFHLMMTAYKMELRPPKEYKKEELRDFRAPVMIFASDEDIFFPAYKVFPKAAEILPELPQMYRIGGNHLPSQETMKYVCGKITEFFGV